ncbi:MAG: hypothetical protein U0441_37270 [Polyangiaceae bacterium]
MQAPCLRPLLAAVVALGSAGIGCADLVGADFDVHPACETCAVVVADGVDHPKSVAVTDGWLFWVESLESGRVMKMPLEGGPPVLIASGEPSPNQIAAGGGYVYWTNTTSDATGGVRRVKASGGDVEDVAKGRVAALGVAVDDTHVYWTEQGTQSVRSLAFGDIPGEGAVLADSLDQPSLVTVNDKYIAFTAIGATGGLYTYSKNGSEGGKVADAPGANAVTLLDSVVCWTTFFAGTSKEDVSCVGFDGEGRMEIAGERDEPTGLVSDGTRLYWGELGAGAIFQAEPYGAPKKIAEGQSGPNGLTLDGDTLYWANYTSSGSLVKLKIPQL